MLSACSMSNSIDSQAIEILKENGIRLDVWNGERYPNKEELKQTWMTLSLDCITKVERPKARQGKMTELSKDKFFFFILSFVFLPNKKRRT